MEQQNHYLVCPDNPHHTSHSGNLHNVDVGLITPLQGQQDPLIMKGIIWLMGFCVNNECLNHENHESLAHWHKLDERSKPCQLGACI